MPADALVTLEVRASAGMVLISKAWIFCFQHQKSQFTRLLETWQCKELGHQQPWYWFIFLKYSGVETRKVNPYFGAELFWKGTPTYIYLYCTSFFNTEMVKLVEIYPWTCQEKQKPCLSYGDHSCFLICPGDVRGKYLPLKHWPLGGMCMRTSWKLDYNSHAILLSSNIWWIFNGMKIQEVHRNCSQHWFRFWFGTP